MTKKNEKHLQPRGLADFQISRGFTLAEVLITLGIIGVVAAMTIPTLVTNYKEKVMVTQNKQAFSIIIQSLNRIKAESSDFSFNTDVFNTSNTSRESTEKFSNYFKIAERNVSLYKIKYMRPTPNLTSADVHDNGLSMPSYNFKLTNGTIISVTQNPACTFIQQCFTYDDDGSVARDEDGRAITEDCIANACASLLVDVNGENLPNQLGKDCFRLAIQYGNYKTHATSYYGNIEYIIKNNKLPPNTVDYELGGLIE